MYTIICETRNKRAVIEKCWSRIEAHHRVEEKVFDILEKGNADTVEPVIHSGEYRKDCVSRDGNGAYAFAYRDELGQPIYAIYKCRIQKFAGVFTTGKRRIVEMYAKVYYAKDVTMLSAPIFPADNTKPSIEPIARKFAKEYKQLVPLDALDKIATEEHSNDELAKLIKLIKTENASALAENRSVEYVFGENEEINTNETTDKDTNDKKEVDTGKPTN